MAQNNWFSRMTQNVATSYAGGGPTAQEATVIGAHNRQIDAEEAAQSYQRRATEKNVAYRTLQDHVANDTRPVFFEDKTDQEWKDYVSAIEGKHRIEGSTDYALSFSDIAKIRGAEAANAYLNSTGMAPSFLGLGKWMDASTTYGMVQNEDGSESFGIIPQVATLDPDTADIRTTNLTIDGSNVADLFAQGGQEGVDAASIQGLDIRILDQMDAAYGEGLIQKGKIQTMARTLQPEIGREGSAISGSTTSTPSFTTETPFTPEERDILNDPNASRAEKARILQTRVEATGTRLANITAQTKTIQQQMSDEEKEASATGDGTFGTNILAAGEDGAIVLPGINAKGLPGAYGTVPTYETLPGDRVYKNLRDKVAGVPGIARVPGAYDFESINVAQSKAYFGDYQVPAGRLDSKTGVVKAPGEGVYPFGLTTTAWSEAGNEGREFLTALEKRIHMNTNVRIHMEAEENLYERFKAHGSNTELNEDGTRRYEGAVGSPTQLQDQANDKTVQSFYKSQGMGTLLSEDDPTNVSVHKTQQHKHEASYEATSKSRLMNRLLSNPELYAEFRDDPYAFALKYANDENALYGAPVTSAEQTAITNAAGNPTAATLTKVEQAIKDKDVSALEEEIARLGTLSDTQQKELANFNVARAGDMYRYDRPLRISTVLGYMAALPQDHATYKALLGNPQTLATFFETGNWTLAGQELQQEAAKLAHNQDVLRQRHMEWATEQAQLLASGELSTDGRNFGTAFRTEMNAIFEDELGWDADGENIQKMGVLIQSEASRLSAAMTADPKLLIAQNRQDYANLMTSQAQLIKQAVLQDLAPPWMLSWFYRDPDAEVLEVNPDIIVYDKNNVPITDPSKVKEARTVGERGGKTRTTDIGPLKDDFGMSIVTYLIMASKDPASK